MNIQDLSTSEKILLAEQLWESVREEADAASLTDDQRSELDRRLKAYELDPEQGDSWAVVKARLLK